MLLYKKTDIQELRDHPVFLKAGVRVLIKREDTNHPTVSGNKWWKLKYNLEQASNSSHQTILTFGGAYSNHIFATAAAARELNLRCIGVIRGEQHSPLNPTLRFATANGMNLHYVNRSAYREKESDRFLRDLHTLYGDFFLIPEGGTNLLAVKGCTEFAEEELQGTNFDHLCLAVGTGGTMAGLVCGLKGKRNIIGVPVLKQGDFLNEDIRRLVMGFSSRDYSNWSLLTGYHHGGYAKSSPQLEEFISEMNVLYRLPLDHVYTGKVLWAVVKEVEAGAFKRGDTIMVIHTGGLQGRIIDPA